MMQARVVFYCVLDILQCFVVHLYCIEIPNFVLLYNLVQNTVLCKITLEAPLKHLL